MERITSKRRRMKQTNKLHLNRETKIEYKRAHRYECKCNLSAKIDYEVILQTASDNTLFIIIRERAK